MNVPYRQIRAAYTEESITVYQAYDPAVAEPAVAAGRFVPPFKRERMTWIKPSFLWMMYRCGWATKAGQTRVLAIDITREGFEWALTRSCPSHPGHGADREEWAARLRRSPVRIQWDPERDPHHNALPYRSVQIGLSGEAVDRYLDKWTLAITDVTGLVRAAHAVVRDGGDPAGLLPVERPYPIGANLTSVIEATPGSAGAENAE
ncbi:DUF4291 domain-containing protein [Planotetraspora kaengkrachanensis]|uniref:DUF4291 domain-containing protein n=1 Tax=Planotetraspora kaengkrachanensis TaxID=575193 RepID=A0A8J3PS01_9ACTN|nr:DUF4291 domain-containing protein [Planotetraspora kaengkrachanensis]GIG80371.1 hypothetical protein Pka01_34980 [Planotetraspora kaengkrachanensis]